MLKRLPLERHCMSFRDVGDLWEKCSLHTKDGESSCLSYLYIFPKM
jgi:hypothetical protein